MLYRVHLARTGFKLTTLVVIGTDCTGSCKSNYHTITTTTAPVFVCSQVCCLSYTMVCSVFVCSQVCCLSYTMVCSVFVCSQVCCLSYTMVCSVFVCSQVCCLSYTMVCSVFVCSQVCCLSYTMVCSVLFCVSLCCTIILYSKIKNSSDFGTLLCIRVMLSTYLIYVHAI